MQKTYNPALAVSFSSCAKGYVNDTRHWVLKKRVGLSTEST